MTININTLSAMERSRTIVNMIVLAAGLGLAITAVVPGVTDEFRHLVVANIAMILALALVGRIVLDMHLTANKIANR